MLFANYSREECSYDSVIKPWLWVKFQISFEFFPQLRTGCKSKWCKIVLSHHYNDFCFTFYKKKILFDNFRKLKLRNICSFAHSLEFCWHKDSSQLCHMCALEVMDGSGWPCSFCWKQGANRQKELVLQRCWTVGQTHVSNNISQDKRVQIMLSHNALSFERPPICCMSISRS